jgi:hypothetical protein
MCGAKRHGTATAYNKGCRCPESREAWRLYNKRRREHRQAPAYIDSTGARRRIQALMAIGWSLRSIHRQLGYAPGGGSVAGSPTIRPTKAAKIAELYDRLSVTPGPSKNTRTYATKLGYAPPIAWDYDTIDDPDAQPMAECPVEVDEVAVQRALSGDRPETLRRPELIEAIRVGHTQGLDDHEIAERLGLHTKTVQRIRHRKGIKRESAA